jgi:NAD+ kinase
MLFAIVSRGDALSEEKKQQAIDFLQRKGFEHSTENPRMVIAIGGDGTVLQAFHNYKHRLADSAFVAYNTGHLGFYSDWDDLASLLTAIVAGKLLTVEYPLLKVTIEEHEKTTESLSLNDFTIKGVKGSVQMDVHLNNYHFESFRGDGLCISTPSGSTGYNKSLGGAIVHPSMDMVQLSEIASINNRVYRTIGSSLIIPKHHVLQLVPKEDAYMIHVDHQSFYTDSIRKVTCMVAQDRIRFLRYRSFPFWSRVKEAFISNEYCEMNEGLGETQSPMIAED